MRDRDWRRRKQDLKKDQVKSYWTCHDPSDPRCVGRIASTPRICSCFACRGGEHWNTRKMVTEAMDDMAQQT